MKKLLIITETEYPKTWVMSKVTETAYSSICAVSTHCGGGCGTGPGTGGGTGGGGGGCGCGGCRGYGRN